MAQINTTLDPIINTEELANLGAEIAAALNATPLGSSWQSSAAPLIAPLANASGTTVHEALDDVSTRLSVAEASIDEVAVSDFVTLFENKLI